MSDINSTTITGRLVCDATMRTASTGTRFARFRVASNSSYKRKNGEQEKETAFVTCKAFGAWAEPLARHRKGDMLVVSGRLKTEEWEKDGIPHSELILMCESLFFISSASPNRGSDEPQMAEMPAGGNGECPPDNGSSGSKPPPF